MNKLKYWLIKGRIYDIVLTHKYWKGSTAGRQYPYALVKTFSMTDKQDQSLIKKGWEHTGYDCYKGDIVVTQDYGVVAIALE